MPSTETTYRCSECYSKHESYSAAEECEIECLRRKEAASNVSMWLLQCERLGNKIKAPHNRCMAEDAYWLIKQVFDDAEDGPLNSHIDQMSRWLNGTDPIPAAFYEYCGLETPTVQASAESEGE